MGVLKFFASIVQVLHTDPESATGIGLDELAANARQFSYIGNRKTLSSLVRQEADELLQRLRAIPDKRLEMLKGTDLALVEMVRAIKSKAARQGFDIAGD